MYNLNFEKTMKIKPFFIKILYLTLILIFCATETHANQNIINVPSSEVLPLGGMQIKQSTDFSPFPSNDYVNLSPSLIFGVGKGFEASLGSSTPINKDGSVRANFAVKKVFYIKKATRLTVGTAFNPYLVGESASDSFIYSHLSHRFAKTKTSITAGGYFASNNNYLPNMGGVLFGVDQVIISKKLRLVADWMSSDTSYGKMGVGFKYRPEPTTSMTVAAIIPNKNVDGIGFKFSVSKYVSLKDFYKKKKGEKL